jgi:hypothetical protein
MESQDAILLEALRAAVADGAADGDERRLYRSGKLPGLLPSRSTAHVAAATALVRDGLIEVVRSETKGKATTEWVCITPKGVDFVLRHDSPARAMDELTDALRLHAKHLPAWVAELRHEIDALSRHVTGEVERIGRRLERLAGHVEAALEQAQRERDRAPVPWGQAALDYLAGRNGVTRQDTCPLPELFAALAARQVRLGIQEFHTGLRRLHERGLVRLLPYLGDGGPPEPEYALPDGVGLLYYAAAA